MNKPVFRWWEAFPNSPSVSGECAFHSEHPGLSKQKQSQSLLYKMTTSLLCSSLCFMFSFREHRCSTVYSVSFPLTTQSSADFIWHCIEKIMVHARGHRSKTSKWCLPVERNSKSNNCQIKIRLGISWSRPTTDNIWHHQILGFDKNSWMSES